MYDVDEAGVELIASFEGFVDGVYNDSEGYATVGYGHLLHYSPATPEDHKVWDGRGRTFYLSLLHEDINRLSVDALNTYVHVSLTQNQVNALASAIYNCGPGFVEGTVGRDLNEERYYAAANAFLLWSNPPVLKARREAERALFLTPEPKAKIAKKVPLPWLEPYERPTVVEYDTLIKHPAKNAARLAVLRRQMRVYIVLIQQAVAKDHNWEINHRRQRYASLVARAG